MRTYSAYTAYDWSLVDPLFEYMTIKDIARRADVPMGISCLLARCRDKGYTRYVRKPIMDMSEIELTVYLMGWAAVPRRQSP